MTAKEQLRRAISDLTEEDAAELLQVLSTRAALDSETAARVLDGIDGAFESAQLGLQQSREEKSVPLDQLGKTGP